MPSVASLSPIGSFVLPVAFRTLNKYGEINYHDMPSIAMSLIRDGMDNAFGLLKNAWDEKIRRFGRVLHESSTSVKLFSMPLSILGGWRPDSHRGIGSIAVNIASRAFSCVHYAPSTMFQRCAALLVAQLPQKLITTDIFIIAERLAYKNEVRSTSEDDSDLDTAPPEPAVFLGNKMEQMWEIPPWPIRRGHMGTNSSGIAGQRSMAGHLFLRTAFLYLHIETCKAF